MVLPVLHTGRSSEVAAIGVEQNLQGACELGRDLVIFETLSWMQVEHEEEMILLIHQNLVGIML